MFNILYKWTWHTNGNPETDFVPIYSDNLTKSFRKGDNLMFFRTAIEGEIKVCNDLFDTFEALPLGVRVYVTLYQSTNAGATWKPYQLCYFDKTDCTWNYDDKICTIRLQSEDAYTGIIDKKDIEYNLIDLKPATQAVTYKRRHALQFYQRGSDFFGMCIGNNYWETPCAPIDMEYSDDGLVHNAWYINDQFYPCIVASQIDINISPQVMAYLGVDSDINTTYNSATADDNYKLQGFAGLMFSGNGKYYAEASFQRGAIVGGLVQRETPNWYYINFYDSATDQPLFHVKKSFDYDDWTWGALPDVLDYTKVYKGAFGGGGAVSYPIQATQRHSFTYVRAVTTLDNAKTLPIEKLQPSSLYDRCWVLYANSQNKTPIQNFDFSVFSTLAFASFDKQADPTEYGKDENGAYWHRPHSNCFPIARNSWSFVSLWFQFERMQALEQWYDEQITVKDAYPLHSAISVLLGEIAPNLTFSNDSAHSEFFYGDSGIKLDNWQPIIVPMTNITIGDYDTPAKVAKIKLEEIFEMLRVCFNCYWFIEGDKLRIEHAVFFDNGGSYNENLTIAIDTTNLANARNGKTADFGQNTLNYDLSGLALSTTYTFADQSTQIFEGKLTEQVQFLSDTASEATEIFYTDIDYALLNADSMNPDTFMLFLSVAGGVPTVQMMNKGMRYWLQNGFGAFTDLLAKYFTFLRAGDNVEINGDNVATQSIARLKRQTLKFTAIEDIEENAQIKTTLGNGIIENNTINLASRLNTFTLKIR